MSKTQSEALQLAEFFGSMKKSSHRWYDGVPVHEKAAHELRRLDAESKNLNVTLDEWLEKTDWVRQTIRPRELGMHLADVLRARIEALDAENKALREAAEEQRAIETIRWPKNAAEVREFFASDFISATFAREDQAPDDGDKYLIAAHDLLSAIDWWACFPNGPRAGQAPAIGCERTETAGNGCGEEQA